MEKFKIKWFDWGREPRCPSDPDFPNGIDIDCSRGISPTCRANLPYPAKRCGEYHVKCLLCGINAMITTAGRPDDPRSIKLPCKRSYQ
jgi:hypothetical protein